MNLATIIDHTTLKANCTVAQIQTICEEAVNYKFKAVCIPPYYVKDAVKALNDSPIKIATVIGFPLGYSATAAKVEEIKRAINDGAHELDVVINICAVKSQDWAYVKNDIDSMTRSAHLKGKIVKVILETGLLTKEEIKKLCVICSELEADYVKTSTGFNGEGVSVEMVRFLKQSLSPSVKIKASGGIRDQSTARQLVEAGANRLGCSASIAIVAG
ncbi:MAG: deoxyribose-phosphate aldolase [Saprospiraceae bacterium]